MPHHSKLLQKIPLAIRNRASAPANCAPICHQKGQDCFVPIGRRLSTNTSIPPRSEEFESLCGPPLIRSPFDNPLRTLGPPNQNQQAQKRMMDPILLTDHEQLKAEEKEEYVQKVPDERAGTLMNFVKYHVGVISQFRSVIRQFAYMEHLPTKPTSDQQMKMVADKRNSMDPPPRRIPLENSSKIAEPTIRQPTHQQQSSSSSSSSSSGEKPEESPEEETAKEKEGAERQWKNVKRGCYVLLGFFTVGAGSMFYVYGPEPQGGDQYSTRNSVLAMLCRVRDAFSFWHTFMKEPVREKLLPDPVQPPWHQPKYTVVIEMRNVLVGPQWDYKKGHYYVKRPALEYFMDVAGYPNFELVIYTSETMMQAAPVVQQLDPRGNRINHALFRECTKTKFMHGVAIKDLSRLNRDLSKVIYIDWDPLAFQLNPENVLRVPKWEGNMEDTALVDLAELLKTIHIANVDDVRPIVQFYSQFDNPMAEFRKRAQLIEHESLGGVSGKVEPDQPLDKYRPSAFNAFGWRRQARI